MANAVGEGEFDATQTLEGPPLETATPALRPFSGHSCHALTWRSHGHSLVGCLPVTSSP